jgi:3-carboxy-cis,cis-muconate cycloisomerase
MLGSPAVNEPRSAGLFAGVFAAGRAGAEVDDRAWLQGMLDFEAALARAAAAAGLPLPEGAAERIAAECRADAFDVDELGRAAAASGNPAVPLVRALSERLPDDAAAYVHFGATSQDAIDTAAMLVAQRALGSILADLAGAADACAALANAHRRTVEVGRTLLQQALPLPFGLKAAGWLCALDEACAALADVRARSPAVQLGGAVGTLASLGDAGVAVAADMAARLGLAEPTMPWHTNRTRPAAIACALGVAAGVVAKVAQDVALLAQTEVAEAREAGGPGRGGSSTMPHKRNPVAAVAARACAQRAPGLVATMLAAMGQEHERAAGRWHAEWETQNELLRVVGSAAAWLRESVAGLEIDAERMRANLDATGDLLMAESVTTRLVPRLGRPTAHALVERAARRAADEGRPLRDALLDEPDAREHLDADGIDAALAPERYLGVADAFIDRALAAHRALAGEA